MFGIDFASFSELMNQGGPIMWPLLILSVLGVTLIFERCWFWLRTNNAASLTRFRLLRDTLNRGNWATAKTMVAMDNSVYGQIVRSLLDDQNNDAAAAAALETQRPRMERFMGTLSTIITAAPMLGILGTVTGLIGSFNVLGEGVSDPRAISPQIAEALITTAAGMVIAIVILFPFNAFRTQIDRSFARVETLLAAAVSNGREQHEDR
jgi:biopolymer transport protein ExbB